MKKITLLKTFTVFCMMAGLPATAQTNVTNTNNSGAGSLRQAVLDVEAGGTITFDAGINGNTIMLESAIEIEKDLIIQGNGDDETIISGSNETQIFIITDSDVTINELTLTEGSSDTGGGAIWATGSVMLMNNITISDSEASGSTVGQGGGAIWFDNGELTLNASVITENSASGSSGSGGGIMVGTDGELTVNGGEISGNFASRAGGGIEIYNSGDDMAVTLNDVTISGNTTGTSPGNGGGLHITGAGDAMISGAVISDNEAESEGGGLWNGSGMMTISGDTMISGNWAHGDDATNGGGGIYNLSGTVDISGDVMITANHADGTSGSGGGIFNDMGGTLEIEDAMITLNTSMRAGGGIEDNGGAEGSVTLMNVTLDSNTAGMNPGNGGGFHMTGMGNASITGGVVSNNEASQGGGLWNGSGMMTVTKVEIEGNTAFGATTNDGGGGIYNNGGTITIMGSTLSENEVSGLFGQGGAVHVNGGTATMMMTTVSGNSSLTNAGGIFNNGDLTINANTITENSAVISGGGLFNNGTSSTTLKNTIVADNESVLGADLFTSGDDIESDGFNLIGSVDNSLFLSTEDDIVGTLEAALDFELLALSDNGGSTRTHRLACPSQAADAGDPEDDSADQADQSVFNGRRDIGAYEEQEVCSTAGVNEFDLANKSLVYPNPSLDGLFNLDLAANHGAGTTISIYEIGTGKLVKSITADSMNVQIGVDNMSTGTYVMQIVSDNATETHKLVVGK